MLYLLKINSITIELSVHKSYIFCFLNLMSQRRRTDVPAFCMQLKIVNLQNATSSCFERGFTWKMTYFPSPLYQGPLSHQCLYLTSKKLWRLCVVARTLDSKSQNYNTTHFLSYHLDLLCAMAFFNLKCYSLLIIPLLKSLWSHEMEIGRKFAKHYWGVPLPLILTKLVFRLTVGLKR